MQANPAQTYGFWLSRLGASQRWIAAWARQFMTESRRQIVPAPVTPNPLSWSDNAITMAWLGHSTVLLNFYGL
ncbi:MAG TPA: hypothetical protein VGE41_01935, partial [Verrucomicrobiae bacterium]